VSNRGEPAELSGELLHVMRSAAQIARELGEPFISTRTLLLALLEDPEVAGVLGPAIPREKLREYVVPDDGAATAQRKAEPEAMQDEAPAIARFDTLAFRATDTNESVWLGREAYSLFASGAERCGDDYQPKHLAFAIAKRAVHAPHLLAVLPLEPGAVTDAIYRL
jgi:hypothetical protein